MNYTQIHDKIIKYIKKTDSRERIRRRNPNDFRLEFGHIYVEVHHIIPRSLGGSDRWDNLVEVLPEEHLFLHMLRYKIFRKREDALAVRFMLNGYDNNKGGVKVVLTKKLRMGYSWLRTHSSFLRKSEGWQTEDGRRRISESRKGTMPVKDVDTGEIIGSVSVSHPNVISGKWVHHTKGRKFSDKERAALKIRNVGLGNPNSSGLSDKYFIDKGVELFREFGRILSWGDTLKISEDRNFVWIKSLRSRFGGRGSYGYYSEVEAATGSKYDPYFTRRAKK